MATINRRDVRAALSQLGINVTLKQAVSAMLKHKPPHTPVPLDDDDNASLVLDERKFAALLAGEFDGVVAPPDFASAPPPDASRPLREQISAWEARRAEAQTAAARIIKANGEELRVLHALVASHRQRLAARQQQPLRPPPTATPIEEEQLRNALSEANELRRRRDALRDANQRKAAELEELRREVRELGGVLQVGAIRPSGGGRGKAGEELEEVEEQLAEATHAQRVLEHMAERLRRQNFEFDAVYTAAQEAAAKERTRVDKTRAALAQATQRQQSAEARLLVVGKEAAAKQAYERRSLDDFETTLATTQAAVVQLEMSRMSRSSTAWLGRLDGAPAAASEGEAWGRLQRKAGLKDPLDLLRQARAQRHATQQLAALCAQAEARLRAARGTRGKLEETVGRLHEAADGAAERRLAQLKEAVSGAEAEVARTARRHQPTVEAMGEVRARIGELLQVLADAKVDVGAEIAHCSNNDLGGVLLDMAEAIAVAEEKVQDPPRK
ncbi:hypothetical protein AB1Y20_021821 [Prymnesium parvum]|uniref:Uncharacterized protein n=1 Tax=Prymnesium parvum TaxID=97485 RepID=A0AB34JMJ1_PRYPA